MTPVGQDLHALTTLRVREAVRGDSASTAWLVERFTPLLLAQASHRLRGPLAALARTHSAEDLVQDVWVRALPRLDGLAARDGRMTPVLVRFLATTMLHRLNSLAQTHLRADGARRQDSLDAAADDRMAESARIVTELAARERVDVVRRAIESLDDDDRALVVLRGIERNPVAEIALLLGEKPNTITVRYRRALDRLRERLPGSVFEELQDDE
ncbi:MAG: sigma-70 family RNA polymerase sigma factor [Planctomycetes bacterium]|nr:sigma-70 family RNA polymerase sigma factor [Planctomycetota bacterium]